MRNFSVIILLFICCFLVLECKRASFDWKERKQLEIKGFRMDVPEECSVKEYVSEDTHVGDINCSKFKLQYEYGNIVSDDLLKDDRVLGLLVQKDTINEYAVRTLIWPGIGQQGSIILSLDDVSPDLDKGEYRFVRRLNIICTDYQPEDINSILSILKTAELIRK